MGIVAPEAVATRTAARNDVVAGVRTMADKTLTAETAEDETEFPATVGAGIRDVAVEPGGVPGTEAAAGAEAAEWMGVEMMLPEVLGSGCALHEVSGAGEMTAEVLAGEMGGSGRIDGVKDVVEAVWAGELAGHTLRQTPRALCAGAPG